MATAEQHYVMDRPDFDKPVKLLIVVASYYKDIADNLIAGAVLRPKPVGRLGKKSKCPALWNYPLRSA